MKFRVVMRDEISKENGDTKGHVLTLILISIFFSVMKTYRFLHCPKIHFLAFFLLLICRVAFVSFLFFIKYDL